MPRTLKNRARTEEARDAKDKLAIECLMPYASALVPANPPHSHAPTHSHRTTQSFPVMAVRAWHESTRSNSRMTVMLRGMVPTSSISTLKRVVRSLHNGPPIGT